MVENGENLWKFVFSSIPQHIYIFGIVLLRPLRFSWWYLHQYEISQHYLTQLRCCTHVTHALCEASSARSFSIVTWTLFRPWTLYRPWTPWRMHFEKVHHVTWRSFAAAPHVTHALRVVSSTRSFSIVPWILFWLWTLYRPWTLWRTHFEKLHHIT